MEEIKTVRAIFGLAITLAFAAFLVSAAISQSADLRREKLYQECLQTNKAMVELSMKAGDKYFTAHTISCSWR